MEEEEEVKEEKNSLQRFHKTFRVSKAEMAEEMFGGSLRLLLGTDTVCPVSPGSQRERKYVQALFPQTSLGP